MSTSEYEILCELGRGGMGVVYKARDRRNGELVALKTLLGFTPSSLYRFKQEFRTLADVTHPNLVDLHELIAGNNHWFFTMEFIPGSDLLTWITAGNRQGHNTRSTLSTGADADQIERSRRALHQLATGLLALHDAGKLHRDLKPGNVRVTPEGRVVILDFGLAAQLDRLGRHQTADDVIGGTVAYMAPEQAAALPVTPACDWYSVGVILYQVLTGTLPFRGAPLRVLRDKQDLDPTPPAELVMGVPEDLNRLCIDLLRRKPEARPSGREILRRVSGDAMLVAPRPSPQEPLRPGVIGRRQHQSAFTDAFRTMKQGQPVVVLVPGQSGVGKSTLLEWFLDDLRLRDEAVTLAGRCYERETVPFKALDNLMDGLSQYLLRLPDSAVDAVLPREVAALARMFPVLDRVPAVMHSPRRPISPDDPELRRRAFTAVRELFIRIGDRKPLVLCLDDLQWGDADSAALLNDLLSPPDPPNLMLVAAYRNEQSQGSSFLREFRFGLEATDRGIQRRVVAVDRLGESEAEELALALLAHQSDRPLSTQIAHARAQEIARESVGIPFFIHELVQHAQSVPLDLGNASGNLYLKLDEVLWTRVSSLEQDAQNLLTVVAVAGHPLDLSAACSAAGLKSADSADTRRSWMSLRSGRLIRSTGPSDQRLVESFHDRIRETVVTHLPPDLLRDSHKRIAATLESAGEADPEILALHFAGADEPDRAARYYAFAAEKASESLAFDHSAMLYESALKLGTWTKAKSAELRAKRGEALANAGRGLDSAEEYMKAATSAEPDLAIELKSRAAYQYCVSGRTALGRTILGDVLKSAGTKLPRSDGHALVSLLWRRLVLHVRGLKYKKRDANQVPEFELRRLELTWIAATGLSMFEPIQAAAFQSRHILLALRAGEPHRLARALAWEAAMQTISGESGLPRAGKLLTLARSIALEFDDPHVTGIIHLSAGLNAFVTGRWRNARSLLEKAGEIYRGRCRGAAWELDTTDLFCLRSLVFTGDFAELKLRAAPLRRAAEDRGDLYAAIMNGTYTEPLAHLADDDLDAARRLVLELPGKWSETGFNILHLHALWGESCIGLYAGQGVPAWERMNRLWALSREPQNLQIIRIMMLNLRARIALAVYRQGGVQDPHMLLRAAERDASSVEREKTAWGNALTLLLRAGIASCRGDERSTSNLLSRAIEALDAVDMNSFSASARRRLGELTLGDAGRALIEQADAWMRTQQVLNPARMTAMHAPGFPL